jgi:hypothetical protein
MSPEPLRGCTAGSLGRRSLGPVFRNDPRNWAKTSRARHSSAVALFRRRCKECGTSAELKVAPSIQGRAGTSEVEFTNFPYLACRCGHVARWAFDPGTDFSEQLFFAEDAVPTAAGSDAVPKCRRCRADLTTQQEVTLEATARIDDFAPIGMRVRLLGYRCPSCGLDQAPPGDFDAGGLRFHRRSSDTGRALDAAVGSIGLSV